MRLIQSGDRRPDVGAREREVELGGIILPRGIQGRVGLGQGGELNGRFEIEVGRLAYPKRERLRGGDRGRGDGFHEDRLLDFGGIATSERSAQAHLRSVHRLLGVQDGDLLVRHVGRGLQFLQGRGVAEPALGLNLLQQGLRRAQAGFAQGHQRARPGEAPIGDFRVADEVQGRGP